MLMPDRQRSAVDRAPVAESAQIAERGKVALAIVAAAGDGVVQQRAIDRARGLITIDFTAELLERALQMRGIGVEIERSEEHTSELQSLMRISYAVFCLKTKTNHQRIIPPDYNNIKPLYN